jgi:hypothetical protein
MNGQRLVIIGIVVFTWLGASAAWAPAPALASREVAVVSSYDYGLDTRVRLMKRRIAFDPGDGLQRWEQRLLAMDPNGEANVGR